MRKCFGGKIESMIQMYELLVVTLIILRVMLLFSLPALGLVLTSKQACKAVMNGDRRLAV